MKEDDKFDVKYNAQSYNIYEFLNNHPGGLNYVQPYKEKDVTKPMSLYEHSKAAYYLLEEYTKGKRRAEEDLESLVNWDKPMLGQVGKLGTKYYEWVTSPVDRNLRLFGNPILECMTITPWYLVPMVWIPVCIYFVIEGTRHYIQITKDASPFVPVVLAFVNGVILWTLIEYSLHRWVFHIEPSGHSKAMIYFHFTIHGLHHKVPFDSRRLVFPPVPAAVIVYIFYSILSVVIPESKQFLTLAGGVSGYVVYDMIHFYLHHGAPKENSYFYHLKRYHNQHHFAHHDNGFGISSTIWDKVFGTAIKLRNLKIGIKW
ncbi:fatty acid 2-hydroxylase [Diabrotica virgifera virgifera]|uniref:Fatty acid 2-hydroxylase n=1 Tax=Diabrotica virgifera virgifera TaxID=50390 RepID=A0A6P7GEW8_DIAVI|nr:fatty acid 2-hydroxylase [Diabrotica virgifera virgifera]XP_050504665.1 fatty acid 2-hydroxylase [Diabrotica virgifera virgifera]XP_050504666.1 fatty acid 2-hydroxylase [Diabrotica virgifera virgifera]XP_050504667.1 fatty acid 2-hydroxylase [Diabrotica virgifera virgifera]XP_050504668.1 fatty acid 2-hydroxylase [Diabrotica virgifera virgifera]XP_050504669.1 fatty acid 2-hydroxylase [Diabrotica virgifera virgifera]